jgi:HPr kinase/phosphorylase
MFKPLTPDIIYRHLKQHIDLQWLAGEQLAERPIHQKLRLSQQATLIGHLNLIHPNRIQVIGKIETAYLNRLDEQYRERTLAQIFERRLAALVISDGIDVDPHLMALADQHKTPLFGSQLSSSELIDRVRFYLSTLLAESTTLHGVFMEVMGTGVLITGDSNVGKSELALELITRGHRLVADDAPVFSRVAPQLLSGACPDVLKDFMEVRGLGVLNIRAMYGENAIKENKFLRLVIHLESMSNKQQQQLDRLYGARSVQTILGVEIPQVMLPVASGRNLAVMVEAAVRNHLLMEQGHNASDEFVRRQQEFIDNQSS